MVGEWSSRNFGDCAALVRDTVSPAEALGAPYVGLEHIGEGTLSLVGRGVAADVTSAKFRFRGRDILFGKLRPYFRKVVMAPFDGVCSTDIWVVRARDAVEQRFLFYYMASPDFVGEATRASEGTKMPRAQWSYLSQLPLALPPLSEQRAIAHILGTLDDKIELNRRMNATLEAIARAIFKSWFVDFDPVHAKARGEQPHGMDAETAALFPDSFENSELGQIPAGWGVGALSNIADNPRRGIKPEAMDSNTLYIGLEHMPQKSITLDAWGRTSNVASNKFKFRKGEFLFGKLRPYFHKVGIAPDDGVCSTDILVIVPTFEAWYGLTLFHISSKEFIDYTTAASTGTRMPRTNWDTMSKYPIVIPDPKVAEAFSCFLRPLLDTIEIAPGDTGL